MTYSSKTQREIASGLIKKALHLECKNCINQIEKLIRTEKANDTSSHKMYLKLYELIDSFNKHIDSRYNVILGAKYKKKLMELYVNGLLTKKDIQELNLDTQTQIFKWVKMYHEYMG